MSEQPLLTIGMAHYDDFMGLWPTIQSIRLANMEYMSKVEFVVVNNSPHDRATSHAIMGLLGVPVDDRLDYTKGVNGNVPNLGGSRYVELPGVTGTSISRDMIFRHARGKYTVVMDCHVAMFDGWLKALLDHYAADPETIDILTGPLLYDNLGNISTHFNAQWSDGMWGTWGLAWKCGCDSRGQQFSILEAKSQSGQGYTAPITLTINPESVTACKFCGKSIPIVPWGGHESVYISEGFNPMGFNDGPAFEIPGQGLGFFSCRTAAWPGFNQHAHGFGGEELYIHEKFRQRGGKALCLPSLKWNHRFYRTGGAKYPNTDFWKCRNYVLEFQELGLPLDPIKKHFVDTPADRFKPEVRSFVSQEAWDVLVADPVNTVNDPTPHLQSIRKAAELLPQYETLDQLFDEIKAIPRDLNEHMPALRVLSREAAGIVVELTARRESTIALLAGAPKHVTSYTTELDNHCFKAANLVKDTTKFTPVKYEMGEIVDIPENDLLFIDTRHNYLQLQKEFAAYAPKCRRFIVLHDTESYGARGDDGMLGLNQAIAEFVDANPEWAIIDHTKEQYGLTVLSRLSEDRPQEAVTSFVVPAGPGTELKKILNSIGVHPGPNCGCNAKAKQMDDWGVEGCELPENFETIKGWISDGVWSKLDFSVILASFTTGLALEINPLHPIDSMVRLCIKRAREARDKNGSK